MIGEREKKRKKKRNREINLKDPFFPRIYISMENISKYEDFLNEKKGPCWPGYKQIGLKKKNGKVVPNCVKENGIQDFEGWISLNEAAVEPRLPSEIYGVKPDNYGKTIGITDKSDKAYSVKDLNLPDKPIGDIAKSAWANLNVPTRGIPLTQNGGLGCAAAVSLMFYRATGLPIIKGREKNPLELGTSTLWSYFTGKDKDRWEIIKNWQKDSKPGDIILTSKGSKAGHVGIVVENNQIISNSSNGFAGDKKGQIELNYTISTWARDTAIKNPLQTASFRYKGPILDGWGGKPLLTPIGTNDEESIKKEEDLPPIVVVHDDNDYTLMDLSILPPKILDNVIKSEEFIDPKLEDKKVKEETEQYLTKFYASSAKKDPKIKKILDFFKKKMKVKRFIKKLRG